MAVKSWRDSGPILPLPAGGFAQKIGFELIYCIFNALKLLIFLLVLNFWAKPPAGEGEGGRASLSGEVSSTSAFSS
jgi:hypothetical protein